MAAKAKKITLHDILVKLDKYFDDCIIFNQSLFCAGDIGDRESLGTYFGLLTNESTEEIRKKYSSYVLEIPSVRDLKMSVDTDKESKAILSSDDTLRYQDQEEKLVKLFDKVLTFNTWNSLPLKDDDYEILLDRNEAIEKKLDGLSSEIQISKGMLPGVTSKSILNITYHAESDDLFDYLYLHEPTEYFDIYMLYTFY